MNTPHAELAVQGLGFSYDEKTILNDVSLQLKEGQLVGLIGPNGAGKSTLLRLLLGLSKPDAGSISIMGQPLPSLRRKELAKLITMVPQDSQINYAFTVEEIVSMGRNPWLDRFQPAGKDDLAIIEQSMQQTDTLQFRDRHINQLSGGERQRVLIARAIAQQTPIIMLDEATANLDLCHQFEILELAHFLAESGRLVIAAIHDLSSASRFCDRLVLLANQGLQADGTPDQVINENNLSTFFNLDADIQPLAADKNGRTGLMITAIGAVNSTING